METSCVLESVATLADAWGVSCWVSCITPYQATIAGHPCSVHPTIRVSHVLRHHPWIEPYHEQWAWYWVFYSDDDEEEILSDGDVNSPAVAAAKPVPRPRNPAASKAKAKPPAAPVAGQYFFL